MRTIAITSAGALLMQRWRTHSQPNSTLVRAQLVELLYHRADFSTDIGFWVHVLNSVHQRGPFGTQLFPHFVRLQRQLFDFLGVSPRVGVLHLVTELAHIAKGLRLGLVAADYFEDVLRVRLGHRSR